ncbi:hypothetical protein VDGL01_09525 [Verticillium dahliae]
MLANGLGPLGSRWAVLGAGLWALGGRLAIVSTEGLPRRVSQAQTCGGRWQTAEAKGWRRKAKGERQKGHSAGDLKHLAHDELPSANAKRAGDFVTNAQQAAKKPNSCFRGKKEESQDFQMSSTTRTTTWKRKVLLTGAAAPRPHHLLVRARHWLPWQVPGGRSSAPKAALA